MTRLYYIFKPVIPRSIQLFLRRIHGKKLLKTHKNSWPILPGSEKKPENWIGWPEGKDFALVLTHDVEWRKGHDKCKQLLEIENKLGFKSSFNLVPERYKVDKELRDFIVNEGFEVGVHGLKHDGKLFRSRKIFNERAIKINQYLKEWNSVGFRAPAVHHKLDWIAELNIEYDLSTFDTDPFEPQPDGVGTIFPFFIERKDGKSGYVEMPYTLDQDFTLFILLKKTSYQIWIDKLNWIAENGGMALINVHPDYLNFENKTESEEYPVSYYSEFLAFIKKNYEGKYWNALPRDVARYFKDNYYQHLSENKGKALKNGRALMVVYSYSPQDVRPRREAEALINAGYEVDMICLRLPDQPKQENVYGVNVYRVNMSKSRSTKRKYITLYSKFFILAFIKLNKLFLKNSYDVIHVHNMPDFLVFLSVIPKIFGAKVVLDLHDPTPEMLITKFSEGDESRLTKLLKWQEKMSIKFSHSVITTNKSFVDRFVLRGCPPDKIKTVMNSPQESVFTKAALNSQNKSKENKFILMYHGLIVERYGLEDLVNAVKLLKNKIPEIELVIYGDGEYVPVLLKIIEEHRLNDTIKYFGTLSLEEIAEIIPSCDIGIIPNRLGPFTQINFPTRIFEYLHMKKPVIVPRTQGINDYFDEEAIFYFDAGNAESLANVIFNIYSDRVKAVEVVNKGYEIYQKHRWESQSKNLIKIYEELLN
ncbi:MAG: glycosyltransferase [Ignavibacteriales bacterium]|nr:glycosyltransferase [Ignavibacteriales bacterium]